jgi:hypothetical protein
VCDVCDYKKSKCRGTGLTSHTEVCTGNYRQVTEKNERVKNVKEAMEYTVFEKGDWHDNVALKLGNEE